MSRRTVAACAVGLMAAAGPLAAQGAQPAQADGNAGDARAGTWVERLSVAARYGSFRPSGGSELYTLLDRALTPGSAALRPRLVGGELHVRAGRTWGVLVGVGGGGSTVASESRAQPSGEGDATSQRTSLQIASLGYVGAEWTALRWRGGDAASDRLRVMLGAGAGVARYRLRQWGDFVDADRAVRFAGAFESRGGGAVGYVSAGAEVPLSRWVAVQADARRQVGSAPMSADYAAFDRIDLGGTYVGVGLRLRAPHRER